MSRRLYLVRHGTAEGAEGRAIGHTDLPLSETGRRAVERLAATWQGPPPDGLLSSPLARAAATASVLATAWGIPPAPPEPRLAEMSFGAWDGRLWDDIHATDGARLAAWADRWWQAPTPHGEGFADLARRVGEWWDGWRAEPLDGAAVDEVLDAAAVDPAAVHEAAQCDRPPGRPRVTVAVTHAGPIRALLVGQLGVSRDGAWDLAVGAARVTAIEIGAGQPPRLVFLDRAGFAEPDRASQPG